MRIGIDLGGTKTEGIVLNDNGNIIARKRQATPSDRGYQAIVDSILKLVGHLESQVGTNCFIGICTPGAISSVNQTMKNANTVCLNGKPLKQDLESILGRKIKIENDANCFALSEAIDGAGADYNTVFGVIMGTGVGGGIIVNKNLLRGHHHISGEWGHNLLQENGPECYCGKRGCVETFLSGPGLMSQYKKAGGNWAQTPDELVQLANNKDATAEQTIDKFYENFGQALSVVVNILDPDAIVLGGGVSNINSLYERGYRALRKHVFNDELRCALLKNKHGDSSGVRGAAWLWPEKRS